MWGILGEMPALWCLSPAWCVVCILLMWCTTPSNMLVNVTGWTRHDGNSGIEKGEERHHHSSDLHSAWCWLTLCCLYHLPSTCQPNNGVRSGMLIQKGAQAPPLRSPSHRTPDLLQCRLQCLQSAPPSPHCYGLAALAVLYSIIVV